LWQHQLIRILNIAGEWGPFLTTGDAFLVATSLELWMKIHSKGFPIWGATLTKEGMIQNFISMAVLALSVLY